MTTIRYINSTEREVGEGHATLSDTLNRGLRDVLTGLGVDPDADFKGLSSTSLGVFNVKDYGAKGDGTTDDTAAIQSAIAVASAATYPVELHFPAGRYKHTADLTIDGTGAKAWLVTGIPGASILVPTVAATVALTVVNDSSGVGSYGAPMVISGLSVDGINNQDGTGFLVGTAAKYTSNVYFDNCHAYNHVTTGIGFHFADCQTIYFHRCSSQGNWINYQFLGSVNNIPTDMRFVECLNRQAYGYGMDIQAGRNFKFTHCVMESNRAQAVYLHPNVIAGQQVPMNNIVFDQCWDENNWNGDAGQTTKYAYDFDATGTTREVDVTMRDCIHGQPSLPIQSNGLRRLTIQNFDPQKQNAANSIRIGGASTVVDMVEYDKAKYNNNPLATVFGFFNGATLAANVVVDESTAGKKTITGNLQLDGGLFQATYDGGTHKFGSATAAGIHVALDGAVATGRTHYFQTAGSLRWQVGAGGSAEGGANAGTSYTISAYDDSGALIDTPVTILRAANGLITFTRNLVVPGMFAGSNTANSGDVILNAAAAKERFTYHQTAGVLRWQVGVDTTAEGGADAGAPYILRAFTDAGALIDQVLTVVRAAGGAVTWTRPIVGLTATANTNSTTMASTAYADRATTHTGTTSAAPTGTTSATAVMMGLAGSITPTRGTKIIVMASGQMANSLLNDGATVDLRFGTGGAPTNGAAVTGTLVGISQTETSLVATAKSGFCVMGKVTGLTVGVAYWLDLSLLAVTAGTATLTGVSLTAFEVP